MKKIISVLSFICIVLPGISQKASRRSWEDIDLSNAISNDTIKRKAFTIVFINKSEKFSKKTGERMIETFFKVYPQEARLYNRNTRKLVTFIIDPEYTGVAAASGGVIKVNPEWMIKNPEDLDVVTHEAMHIVQNYPGGAGPGWVTEGVADYVRYKLGVNNTAGNWSLPEFSEKQHYTNAYRVTARFFVWIEKNHNRKLVKQLDHAMRTKTYTENFWKKETGKTVDELWDDYKKNPKI
ncbi:MAG TPA: basic secretory protein-like protein [Niabella sp.]|nr:basic secretory protein-like protein [Niabella sp.]